MHLTAFSGYWTHWCWFCYSSNVLHVDGCNYPPGLGLLTSSAFMASYGFITTLCLWHPHVCWVHAAVLSVVIDSVVHADSLMATATFCATDILISTDVCEVQTSSAQTDSHPHVMLTWGRISRVLPPWSQSWSQSILDKSRHRMT